MLQTWQPGLNVSSIKSISKAKPNLAVIILNFLGSYMLLASGLGQCYINAPNPFRQFTFLKFENPSRVSKVIPISS